MPDDPKRASMDTVSEPEFALRHLDAVPVSLQAKNVSRVYATHPLAVLSDSSNDRSGRAEIRPEELIGGGALMPLLTWPYASLV